MCDKLHAILDDHAMVVLAHGLSHEVVTDAAFRFVDGHVLNHRVVHIGQSQTHPHVGEAVDGFPHIAVGHSSCVTGVSPVPKLLRVTSCVGDSLDPASVPCSAVAPIVNVPPSTNTILNDTLSSFLELI